MSGRRRLSGVAAVAGALLLGAPGAPGPPATLARLTDADASSASLLAGTLDPPTALAAVATTSVTLTWIPTVDAAATGYRVYRSTTSGSGHAQVGSDITPRTAVSATDAPSASGTYYYVVRSYVQSWLSAPSVEATALVLLAPVTTTWAGCNPLASVAEAGWGDGDGYQVSPANACVDGAGVANDAGTGIAGRSTACTNQSNDAHRFAGFSPAVPPTATILGIEVRADLGMNNNGGASAVCAQLSWDGGTTWTAPASAALSGTAESTSILGGSGDTWGRAWTAAELADASLRVRLVSATSQGSKNYLLDLVAVRVTYRP